MVRRSSISASLWPAPARDPGNKSTGCRPGARPTACRPGRRWQCDPRAGRTSHRRFRWLCGQSPRWLVWQGRRSTMAVGPGEKIRPENDLVYDLTEIDSLHDGFLGQVHEHHGILVIDSVDMAR